MEQIETQIMAVEAKVSGNNKQYHRVNTSAGWMSTWKLPIAEKLKTLIGHNAVLNYSVRNVGDKTYRTIEGVLNHSDNPSPVVPTPQQNTQTQSVNVGEPNLAMLTSYAKDIFCAVVEQYRIIEKNNWNKARMLELMQFCTELVKEARDGFETEGGVQ